MRLGLLPFLDLRDYLLAISGGPAISALMSGKISFRVRTIDAMITLRE